MDVDLTAPVTVRRFHIRGLRNTREHVVRNELAAIERATTLGELRDACMDAASNLQSLGIFEAADLLLDEAPMDRRGGGVPYADVVCTVREKKRFASASTTVSTQKGEGSMEAKVALRNALGHAEKIELQMESGQHSSSSFKLEASRQRFMGTDVQVSADVTKQAISHIKHSSFVQKLLGTSVSAQVGSADEEGGSHTLGGSLELRDVCRLTPHTASWAVIQQQGQSLKSALTHSYTRTTIDAPLVPTSGWMVRLASELAGVVPLPIGDACFFKSALTGAAFVPVLPHGRLTVGLHLQAGLLMPLANEPAESNICDRFFVGGPGSFWGFRSQGIGPRDARHSLRSAAAPAAAPPKPRRTARDALGGDVYAVGTASLSTALPGKLGGTGARAHAFISAGSLETFSSLHSAGGGSLAASLRASVGAGVAFPSALGRLELNLVHALRKSPTDAAIANGVQIGVSNGFT